MHTCIHAYTHICIHTYTDIYGMYHSENFLFQPNMIFGSNCQSELKQTRANRSEPNIYYTRTIYLLTLLCLCPYNYSCYAYRTTTMLKAGCAQMCMLVAYACYKQQSISICLVLAYNFY